MDTPKAKVIVLSRDPASRRFFAEELRARGYFAIAARDPLNVKEYLTIPPQKRYQLVIVEIQPRNRESQDNECIALCRFLQEAGIPVIILTELEKSLVHNALRGQNENTVILTRPFGFHELLELVAQVCQQTVSADIKAS